MRLRPTAVLILIAGFWSSWFILHTWFRHLNLFTSSYDLGNMDQVLWQTLHGHFFQLTSPTEGILQSRTAIHADWLLLIYLPFYALWANPLTLTTLQVLFVAGAVFPLFWLAQRRLSNGWSLGLATLYLLQPSLEWSVIFDVHALVLVTPLIIWGVWAATNRRLVLLWIFFMACVLAKEEVGLVIALIALVLALKKIISRRTAFLLAFIGLSWVALTTTVIIPAFAENGSHFAISYFSEYGRTVPEILVGMIRHPVLLWRDLVNITSVGYLTIILGSAAFLALRKPLWLLPAAPIIAMNLISNDPQLHSIFFQYTAALTPFVLLASLDGLAVLQKQFSTRLLMAWTVGWLVVMVWIWAPLPGTRYTADALKVFRTNPYRHIVHQLAATIPTSVPLAVSNDLGPQFDRRDRMWVFPFALDRAQAVVVLLNRAHDVRPQPELRQAVNDLLKSSRWQLIQEWNNELFYFTKKKVAKVSTFSVVLNKTPINMGIR